LAALKDGDFPCQINLAPFIRANSTQFQHIKHIFTPFNMCLDHEIKIKGMRTVEVLQ